VKNQPPHFLEEYLNRSESIQENILKKMKWLKNTSLRSASGSTMIKKKKPSLNQKTSKEKNTSKSSSESSTSGASGSAGQLLLQQSYQVIQIHTLIYKQNT